MQLSGRWLHSGLHLVSNADEWARTGAHFRWRGACQAEPSCLGFVRNVGLTDTERRFFCIRPATSASPMATQASTPKAHRMHALQAAGRCVAGRGLWALADACAGAAFAQRRIIGPWIARPVAALAQRSYAVGILSICLTPIAIVLGATITGAALVSGLFWGVGRFGVLAALSYLLTTLQHLGPCLHTLNGLGPTLRLPAQGPALDAAAARTLHQALTAQDTAVSNLRGPHNASFAWLSNDAARRIQPDVQGDIADVALGLPLCDEAVLLQCLHGTLADRVERTADGQPLPQPRLLSRHGALVMAAAPTHRHVTLRARADGTLLFTGILAWLPEATRPQNAAIKLFDPAQQRPHDAALAPPGLCMRVEARIAQNPAGRGQRFDVCACVHLDTSAEPWGHAQA